MSALIAIIAVGSILYLAGVVSLLRHLRIRGGTGSTLLEFPPVSVIKVIKGSEDGLEKNVASFFEQDYPGTLELVFSATDDDDSGIAIAETVATSYPSTPTKFVKANIESAQNPKVANVLGALEQASYDLILQTDANIRISKDYLSRVVAEYVESGAALLSSIIVGVGERSLGAVLENMQLTTVIAPSVAFVTHIAGRACVVSKSIVYRKSEFAEIGAGNAIKDVLCDDFLLGAYYEAQGRRVILSKTAVVANVNENTSVQAFLARHSRWLKMNAAIHFPAFATRLIGNPFPLALLAFAIPGYVGMATVLAMCVIGMRLACDRMVAKALGRQPFRFPINLLTLIKDVAIFLLWPYAAVSRSVGWRGMTFLLTKNSRIVARDIRT